MDVSSAAMEKVAAIISTAVQTASTAVQPPPTATSDTLGSPPALHTFLNKHLAPVGTSLGACVLPGPVLDRHGRAIVARTVDPATQGAWTPIDLEETRSNLRVFRRPTADEGVLVATLQAHLDGLGLTTGMRPIAQTSGDHLSTGTMVLRSLAGCGRQRSHQDRAHHHTTAPSFAHLPFGQVPLSVIWALEDQTTIIINEERYRIPKGQILVFRGDVCHAGDGYPGVNTRIHAYLDLADGRYISPFTGFC